MFVGMLMATAGNMWYNRKNPYDYGKVIVSPEALARLDDDISLGIRS